MAAPLIEAQVRVEPSVMVYRIYPRLSPHDEQPNMPCEEMALGAMGHPFVRKNLLIRTRGWTDSLNGLVRWERLSKGAEIGGRNRLAGRLACMAAPPRLLPN